MLFKIVLGVILILRGLYAPLLLITEVFFQLTSVDFEYCKTVRLTKSLMLPTSAGGCNCKGECVDPRTCSCARLNGGDFPYVRKDGGRCQLFSFMLVKFCHDLVIYTFWYIPIVNVENKVKQVLKF